MAQKDLYIPGYLLFYCENMTGKVQDSTFLEFCKNNEDAMKQIEIACRDLKKDSRDEELVKRYRKRLFVVKANLLKTWRKTSVGGSESALIISGKKYGISGNYLIS